MTSRKFPNKAYWRRKRREFILKYGAKAWDVYLRRRRQKRYWKTPKGCYVIHKNNAKHRGVEWLFDFETWWAKWQRSGKWKERGNKKGQYVMARIGDSGPYSDRNTMIVRSETNAYASFVERGFAPLSDSSSYREETASIL